MDYELEIDMRFHLHTIKSKTAESGHRLTWQQIADATGIRESTLRSLANNRARTIRPEYVDALCTFLGVTAAELITAERVTLPLEMNLRPDRHGKQIGEV
jgi:DNA-binding Xre family transcriptional regulator